VVLTKLDGSAKGGIVLAIQPSSASRSSWSASARGPTTSSSSTRRVRRRPVRLMFDALSDRFDGIFKTHLRGKGKLTEEDVDEVLREIRLALLEADVNFQVVKGLQSPGSASGVGEELSRR
jgi:signal recognition particle GTPase